MPNTTNSIRSTVRLFAVFMVVWVPEAAATEACSSSLIETGLPPRDVHRSAAAASLSALVYQTGDEPELTEEGIALLESNGFSFPKHFVAPGDRGLGARHGNDYCMMAFRGTKFLELEDLISNIKLDIVEFISIAQDYYNEDDIEDNDDDLYIQENTNGTLMSCDIHQGYYNAYLSFKDEMEDYLDSCVQECPECDVVLTGHSQGGGIAEIYALLNKKRFSANPNPLPPPYVITFGAIQSLGKGCMRFISKEERCHHYHYMQGMPGLLGGNTLDFDYIPFSFATSYLKAREEGYTGELTYVRNGVAAPGHFILVSNDDPLSTYYLGYNGNFTYRVTDLPIGLNIETHSKFKYMETLNNLGENYAYGSDPLPTNGFSLGTVCDIKLKLCQDGLECRKIDQKETCRPIGEESSSGGGSSKIRGGWLSILMITVASIMVACGL